MTPLFVALPMSRLAFVLSQIKLVGFCVKNPELSANVMHPVENASELAFIAITCRALDVVKNNVVPSHSIAPFSTDVRFVPAVKRSGAEIVVPAVNGSPPVASVTL